MTNMWRNLKTLPSAVWLIGAVSLLNDSASEMVYPLLPLYLSSVLMAGPRALGFIEGIAEATSSLLKLFSGVLMDRMRRAKPFMLLGYAFAGLGRPLIAIVSSWQAVLVIRFVDRVGKGLRSSPRDALLAASVAPAQRGLAFGIHRAMDNAGAVVGPLLAAALLAAGQSLQTVFFVALLPGILCLLLLTRLREPAVVLPTAMPTAWNGKLHLGTPVFVRYLCALAVFTLGHASSMFLLLRAHELGLTIAQVPLVWAAVSGVAAVFAAPLAAWSDRIGRARLIIAGWCAYGLLYLVMAILPSHSLGLLFLLFSFYGLFLAATEGVEKALVADLAPAEQLGTAFGWFNLIAGLLLLPASMIFGALYQHYNAATAFYFSAACTLTAAILMAFWVRVPSANKNESALS